MLAGDMGMIRTRGGESFLRALLRRKKGPVRRCAPCRGLLQSWAIEQGLRLDLALARCLISAAWGVW